MNSPEQEVNNLERAQFYLREMQIKTMQRAPLGTVIERRRGRGMAKMTVVGYPKPDSIRAAQSVFGRSKNKDFTIPLDEALEPSIG